MNNLHGGTAIAADPERDLSSNIHMLMEHPVMSAERTVSLPTGTLHVTVERADWPLEELCDFAARENPKRGFLVVSRVLGRHIPAVPSTMRRSVRDLASQIQVDLPGPVMVIGLAETAVCLGQTLHEEWRGHSGRQDVGFVHSTRQLIDAPLLCRFEEPHSHASAHLIYRPDAAGIDTPRTIILVDDEVSTGTTLRNLANALVACWPRVERIVIATLTEWSADATWQTAMPRPAEVHSLLKGTLHWTTDVETSHSPSFERNAGFLGRMPAHANYGRLGIGQAIAAPPRGDLPKGSGPLRIVGTGEFTYLPFLLAERLETAGHDVVVQATSRSPARLGAAIRSKLCFADNYDTGVANYLYNAGCDDGRRTLICHETPAGSVDQHLIAALDADLLGWAQ